MNIINTGASARWIYTSDSAQPFQGLSPSVETIKTVCRSHHVCHRAEAAVLMTGPTELSKRNKWLGRALPLLLSIIPLVAACRRDMMNQPKAKPLSESDFFSDQANARPIPPHTVAWRNARENDAFYTGLTNGTYITELPVKLTPALMARGRERFEAMCAECHDRTGSGNGMVVLRGFPQPPSYHVPRLRNAPIGHFFDVITNGYGVMYSYATRVEPEDRWAIAAYIRALQLSHNANASDLAVAEQQKLESRK